MRAYAALGAAACALILAGCANRGGIAPSQNPTLQSVSPTTTEETEGGIMQRGLDAWLKEEWEPLTAPEAAPEAATSAHQVPAEEPATQTAPASVSAAPAVSEPATPPSDAQPAPQAEDDEPFSLQKYVDKWKRYNENKPASQEPSHTEKVNSLPAIGK